MLLEIQFSWQLIIADIVIYAVLQTTRIWVDILLPHRLLDPESKYFRTKKWEREGKFYQDFFHINAWKDKLPAVKGLTKFSKKHLENRTEPYLRQFVLETCRAESHHTRTIIETSIFIIWNPMGLFIVIFITGLITQLPFVLIQRYNRARLQNVLRKIDKENQEQTQQL